MPTVHAKLYPPSSAGRYVHCPGSVTVVPLYPNDDSDHSVKGDVAHDLLEVGIMFGVRPQSHDPDMDENVEGVLDYVDRRRAEMPGVNVYPEQRLAIKETGEFGTSDIVFDAQEETEIGDYKNGYVLVHVRDPKTGLLNEQLMSYLLGAIAKYGPKQRYRITLFQPNHHHIDGPIRSEEVTHQDVQDFRTRLAWAVGSREFFAGPWCKKSYCPHRGSCTTFNDYVIDDPAKGWHTSEINAITEQQLADALDRADVLHGSRDELRKEAMRRILNLDRTIPGYKMVKGKKDRQFASEKAVIATLGTLGWAKEDMYDSYSYTTDTYKLKTVKGIEDTMKVKCRVLGRGKWKAVWDEHIQPLVREYVGGLTLERATDGRPAHKRGSEFGALAAPNTANITHTV